MNSNESDVLRALLADNLLAQLALLDEIERLRAENGRLRAYSGVGRP